MSYLHDALEATGAKACHLSPRRGLAHAQSGGVERVSYFTPWDGPDVLVDANGVGASGLAHHCGAWPPRDDARLAGAELLNPHKWLSAFAYAHLERWRFASIEGSALRHLHDSVTFRDSGVADRRRVDIDVPTLGRYKITRNSRLSLPSNPGQKLAIFDDAGVSFFPIMGM